MANTSFVSPERVLSIFQQVAARQAAKEGSRVPEITHRDAFDRFPASFLGWFVWTATASCTLVDMSRRVDGGESPGTESALAA